MFGYVLRPYLTEARTVVRRNKLYLPTNPRRTAQPILFFSVMSTWMVNNIGFSRLWLYLVKFEECCHH
ncbi:hypothetical protein CBL_05655 [Carabus blaptoides fortunei]